MIEKKKKKKAIKFTESAAFCRVGRVTGNNNKILLGLIMIIPLPHYGNNFATTNFGRKKMCRSPPPPPFSAVARASAILSETFPLDCGSVVSLLPLLTWCGVVWYGNGSGALLLDVHGDVTVHVVG